MNLAVGFFDGVHIGHQRILAHADAALTFTNHPATVYAPDRAPRLLMTAEERLAAISALGVGRVIARDFTPTLAAQTPGEFAESLRREFPDLDTVFCGPNWTFGAGGSGTAETLRALGSRVTEVPFATWRDEPVSSTRIRAALGEGDVSAAAAMLGRPYAASGRIVHGKGAGRQLGFPTLNVVSALGELPLARGVYAVDTPLGHGIPRLPRCGWLSRRSSARSAPLPPSPSCRRNSSGTSRPSWRPCPVTFRRPARRQSGKRRYRMERWHQHGYQS